MLILMESSASAGDVERVKTVIEGMGYSAHVMPGAQATAIGVTGNEGPVSEGPFAGLPGIARLIRVSRGYKLVSREFRKDLGGGDTVVRFGPGDGEAFGGGHFGVIAGPCSVESREQIMEIAHAVKAAGASFLRGGAFKPRTHPYAFQGMKEEGLKLLAEAREQTGLQVVTEVKDTETLDMVAEYADVLQIGARNMQNFSLLEAVGRLDKPVLLKRGLSAKIEELLSAAEYIASGRRGRPSQDWILLCERGIRTFETATRNTFDVNAFPVLSRWTHLPALADPSHGVGIASDVPAVAMAAMAAGASGLIIEVHHDPGKALSDGQQSLTPAAFARLMDQLRLMAPILGRKMQPVG